MLGWGWGGEGGREQRRKREEKKRWSLGPLWQEGYCNWLYRGAFHAFLRVREGVGCQLDGRAVHLSLTEVITVMVPEQMIYKYPILLSDKY